MPIRIVPIKRKRPGRATTGDRAVQKRKRLMKRAQDKTTSIDKARAYLAPRKRSKGGKIMKAMGGKMMKSKGYSKGGTRMMMKAMGGKMAKGYAKGGAKMIRAQSGKEIKRPKNMISSVRTMKKNPMTKRQLQLAGAKALMKARDDDMIKAIRNRPKMKVKTGTDKVSKLVTVINKLPRSGKLALAGGLTAGTIALISKLNPGAKRAGKQVRELKKNKKKK